jgi:hypothetical protein
VVEPLALQPPLAYDLVPFAEEVVLAWESVSKHGIVGDRQTAIILGEFSNSISNILYDS